ncbi:MAG: AI-2E family transporter [Chloroflexota bacterium]|nr:AI-2E family transporter [Chloroflexota bacterium]
MTIQAPPPDAARTSPPYPLREASVGSLWRAAAILGVGLVLALGLLAAIWLLAQPLAMLAAAVVLAQAVEPAICRLERRCPRAATVGLVYLVLLALFGGLLWLVVPPLLDVAREAVTKTPSLIEEARTAMSRWDPMLVTRVNQMADEAARVLTPVLAEVPVVIFETGIGAVLILVMAAYWSLATPDLRRFSFSFVPRRDRDATSDVISEIVATMGGYVRARVLTALVVAVVTWASLSLIGVEYAPMLTLLAGLGELVPFIGPALAFVPALVVALLASPTQAVLVFVLYLVVQQLKSHLLVPLLTNQQARIPPLVVIFAVIVGGSIGGVIGAAVATPLAGALRVIIIRVIAPAIRRRVREDTGDELAASPSPPVGDPSA